MGPEFGEGQFGERRKLVRDTMLYNVPLLLWIPRTEYSLRHPFSGPVSRDKLLQSISYLFTRRQLQQSISSAYTQNWKFKQELHSIGPK